MTQPVTLPVTQPADPLAAFHPAIQAWFRGRFAAPTDAQAAGWPAIQSGRDTLVAAPTGSGKTLTAFLAGIDALVREAEQAPLPDATRILYLSPLRALGNDIHRNLEVPLREIRETAARLGTPLPEIRTGVRTGDTPPSQRQALTRKPPHILITTPESLYLLLTSERGRAALRTVRTVIVDEIHALVRDKRGSHLALSLARLDHVTGARAGRIGLSATQRPIAETAAYLVGSDRLRPDGTPDCTIVDLGHQRDLDLAIEVPPSDLEAVISQAQWADLYDRLAQLITAHRTTLVFVNTRRHAERIAHHLAERLGEEHVASHHGSLSKERRLRLEDRLRAGDLRALVATASLELGIDVGSIDLVCQIGSPRSVATFLQRVGRSGHALGLRPRGRLIPTTRDELLECAALVRAVRAGRLDRIVQPVGPLDVLAQQIVAECAAAPWAADALYALCRRAAPYRALRRTDFDAIVAMLSEGIGEGGGRARPLLHHDRIHGMLRGRREARLTALINGGVIPELGDYRVVLEPDGTVIGSVNEDWAIESSAGDIFLLGSTSWRIKRIEEGQVRVEDARGAPPTIPFWLGEAPGRTPELSAEVGRLRREIGARLENPAACRAWLRAETAAPDLAAAQMVDYVRATQDALGVMPSDTDIVFERFFDESGGMQLVVHAPFGARINRAWGLALRKRFCVRFDFELQAAATDDAILLSLGPAQSFPLEEAFGYVKADNAEFSVRQAILYVPLFGTRWRWNTTRALAVPRRRGSRRVPPPIQRMIANDLLAAVFPAQVGCQENVTGPLEIPDHPLVQQTMDDCLREAMDIDGLLAVLERIEAGAVRLHARDTTEPSPMSHEVISARPYAFLDDAPLEERRARAVTLRRALPENGRDLGALDADAIGRVREEARPTPRDVDEAHETLLSLVAVHADPAQDWQPLLAALRDAGRAATAATPRGAIWFAREHLPAVRLLYPDTALDHVHVPPAALITVIDREDARLRLLRGHLEISGPVTPAEVAARAALDPADADRGLRQLEATGVVLRGRFRPGAAEEEFCERGLLARIHRYTLERLRREIDPVSAQDFLRFLLRWHGLTPDTRMRGRAGLRQALLRLQGFEAPAVLWERDLLPARVADYVPGWLDDLSLSGEAAWARLTPRRNGSGAGGSAITPSRQTPITLLPRASLPVLLLAARHGISPAEPEGGAAREILALLRSRGALFPDEIVAATRRLPDDVEGGLRDLVARGLAAADGFHGLRRLIGGRGSRPPARRRAGAFAGAFGGTFGGGRARAPAGRWAVLPDTPPDAADIEDVAEATALVLLHRYGVIFRDLLARESLTLPWREILRALRRMEARGQVRGGRFVGGRVGEQYALPEAVEALRAVRRQPLSGERVTVSAVDPCNLVGIIVPGEKVPARPGLTVTYVDGAPDGAAPRAATVVSAGG